MFLHLKRSILLLLWRLCVCILISRFLSIAALKKNHPTLRESWQYYCLTEVTSLGYSGNAGSCQEKMLFISSRTPFHSFINHVCWLIANWHYSLQDPCWETPLAGPVRLLLGGTDLTPLHKIRQVEQNENDEGPFESSRKEKTAQKKEEEPQSCSEPTSFPGSQPVMANWHGNNSLHASVSDAEPQRPDTMEVLYSKEVSEFTDVL